MVGSIHDVASVARLVHAAGAEVCVDGVAYAPHRLVDVKAWDVDYYLCSLYKVFGPHLGALYGKRDKLVAARGQNHFFIGEEQVPYKLQPGNVNHELTAGLAGVLEYFVDLAEAHGITGSTRAKLEGADDLISAHEAALAAPLLEDLAGRSDVRLLGEPTADRSKRVPTIAFAVDGRPSQEVATALEAHQLAVRWGDFYASRAIDALGLRAQGGVVRVSMAHYNTAEEVDRLLRALDAVL